MIKKLTIGCIGILLSVNNVFAIDKLHTGKVLESMDAGIYTYVKFQENTEIYWAAIPKSDLKIGELLTIKESTWMTNFESKTLNKTFDKVMFADFENPKKAIHGASNVHGIHGQMTQEEKPNPKFEDIIISKEKAIKTDISDLFTNKNNYKNKNVQIEGEVVQVSNKVMGNTWIKISNGKDAVIFRSTNEDENVKIGDKITGIATLNTDVDYGYGFKYEIIGVNASISKKE